MGRGGGRGAEGGVSGAGAVGIGVVERCVGGGETGGAGGGRGG